MRAINDDDGGGSGAAATRPLPCCARMDDSFGRKGFTVLPVACFCLVPHDARRSPSASLMLQNVGMW